MKQYALSGFIVLALFSAYAFGTENKGYPVSERRLLDNLYISAEYEARIDDLRENIAPLSIADLEDAQ